MLQTHAYNPWDKVNRGHHDWPNWRAQYRGVEYQPHYRVTRRVHTSYWSVCLSVCLSVSVCRYCRRTFNSRRFSKSTNRRTEWSRAVNDNVVIINIVLGRHIQRRTDDDPCVDTGNGLNVQGQCRDDRRT